jgi:single-strand DNA-binding protein
LALLERAPTPAQGRAVSLAKIAAALRKARRRHGEQRAVAIREALRAPQLEQPTHTGMRLAYFRVATNGRDDKDTEFHQCTAFGKTAEFISEYLTTGRLVDLDGRLQTRTYDDPDGVRRWVTTIVVNRLQVLDHRRTEH